MRGERIFYHHLIITLFFCLLFALFSFTSYSKLDALSSFVSSYLLSENKTSLNIDIDTGADSFEAAFIADEISRRRYTNNFENAKALVRSDEINIVVAPSLDVHTNPNGEYVLSSFEMIVDKPAAIYASSSLLGKEAVTINGATFHIDSFVSGGTADFFEQTIGPFIIVSPESVNHMDVVINFDLSKGVSSNSSYLSYLNKEGLLEYRLRVDDQSIQNDFDSLLNSYLSSSFNDLPIYLTIVVAVILFEIMCWVLFVRPSEAIGSFFCAYVVLQIYDNFVSSVSLLTTPSFLAIVFAVLCAVIIYMIRTRKLVHE